MEKSEWFEWLAGIETFQLEISFLVIVVLGIGLLSLAGALKITDRKIKRIEARITLIEMWEFKRSEGDSAPEVLIE